MSVPKTRRRRKQFKPEQVSVLFVGESPPASGDFFYDGNSLLYRATLDAFRQFYGQNALPDGNFLSFFRSVGCYLEDLSERPLDGIKDPSERRDAREACQRSIGQRIRQHAPDVVIIVVKGIEADVRAGMAQFHIGHIPVHTLPFPTYHRKAYITELGNVLRQLARRSALPSRTQLHARREAVNRPGFSAASPSGDADNVMEHFARENP